MLAAAPPIPENPELRGENLGWLSRRDRCISVSIPDYLGCSKHQYCAQVVGKGAYGEAIKCVEKSTKHIYCIKQVDKGSGDGTFFSYQLRRDGGWRHQRIWAYSSLCKCSTACRWLSILCLLCLLCLLLLYLPTTVLPYLPYLPYLPHRPYLPYPSYLPYLAYRCD